MTELKSARISAILICFVMAGAARADVVYLNVPSSEISGSTTGAQARFRMSSGVDQMIYPGSSPGGIGTKSADLFTLGSPYVASVTYDFSLSNNAITKQIQFNLFNGSGTGSVSLLNAGPSNLNYDGQSISYNILRFNVDSRLAGSTVSFNNLFFNPGAGLTTSGSLNESQIVGSGTTYDQFLASETGTNLGNFDWQLGGQITLAASGTNPSSGEQVKFQVSLANGNFTAVPEPSTLVTMGLIGLPAFGFIFVWFRSKRGKQFICCDEIQDKSLEPV